MATAPAVSTNNLFDRLPPQNLDAERSVLGSILLVNEAIDEVAEFLDADHFYGDAHRRMYAAIAKLHDSGIRGIDAVTLGNELALHSELEEVGGVPYLVEVLESVPHAGHARYYANIVRDKSVQRSLIYACTEILRESYDPAGDTEELLQSAEKQIFQILEGQEETAHFDIGNILIDAWDRINERLESDDSFSGLPTGYTDFDAKTNGLQPSELIILAARPSMGKTALACNWAVNIAAATGRGVLFFSLEQSRLELAERFLCIRSQINGHKLRSGDLDEEERDKLMKASQELSEIPLFIDDKPGRTVGQMGAIARRLKRQNDIGLMVIDYLQFVEPEDRQAPREQQIALITRRLKNIGKELGIPVIALAQLNRGVEMREDKRPRLADLRESGAIEQDADLVTFLHRPDAYDPTDQPGVAEVIIAKHRSGPTGIVPLTWRAEIMRFENLSPLVEPDGGYFGDDSGSSDGGF
ncbi:MAG: replicative DNA helicase [Planctomycetaceae bacterium]|jgi:replicative DNA helicase|nr:replicative DNA helicase [Planctomycetaceae bacterium]MBT6484212.1 replicative DNA helicase [Planctomycetaceae bacterium]MBT6494677.1 replicative DNA helicase [Planctomycetaceae bacterium]